MTPRDRRALLWGGAVILTAVLGLRVLPQLVTGAATARRDLQARAALLARARAELAALPALRDSAAVLTRALVAAAPHVLDGPTPEEAGTDLMARLQHAAGRAPARVERMDPLPDSTSAGRLGRARARAVLETDVRGLVALLREVEAGDARLDIAHLAVTTTDLATPERRPEVLRVEIEVAGWFLSGPR